MELGWESNRFGSCSTRRVASDRCNLPSSFHLPSVIIYQRRGAEGAPPGHRPVISTSIRPLGLIVSPKRSQFTNSAFIDSSHTSSAAEFSFYQILSLFKMNEESGLAPVPNCEEVVQSAQIYQRGHITCIPVEVLTDAFTYLLPESLAIDDILGALEMESDWFLHGRRRHDDLIHITHVCRSWRRMCLSTPSFWSLIWVTDEDRFALRTEEFIRRSGSMPLEIAVVDHCSRVTRKVVR